MSNAAKPSESWIYEGVWGMLSGIFCVPRDPPELPFHASSQIIARQPSPGFVRYLKFQFWIGLLAILIAVVLGSIGIALALNNAWIFLGSVVLLMVILPISALNYLVIYLRNDTMWYVFSDRSMRLRRGIWQLRESTITFENIQNVKVTQGPLQRYFGIANVVVETAGGGGGQNNAQTGSGTHSGLIEGVSEAAAIRDSIMTHVHSSQTTGLGDETITQTSPGLSPKHLMVLREIRDLAKTAANQ